jgi:hypothetical protein
MSPHELGQLLAHISVETEDDMKRNSARSEALSDLKQRIDSILETNFNSNRDWGLPKGSCAGEHPFLLDNRDFFIAYLMADTNGTPPLIDCAGLIHHLNDCYRCFEVFSQTLQAYYQVVSDNHSHIKNKG